MHALESPSLYRAMFFEATAEPAEAVAAASTFAPVVDAFERAIAAARISVSDAWDPAVRLWAFTHGTVSLVLGGLLTTGDLLKHLEDGFTITLVGLGDRPRAVEQSLRSARTRMTPAEGLPTVPSRGLTLNAAAGRVRRSQ